MIDKLVTGTKVLEKSLNASWYRNEAISQNIANVDTPKYRRKEINFEEYLRGYGDSNFVGNRTHENHIRIGKSDINNVDITLTEDDSNLDMRLDGNNVDIDSEMALMAKNSIKYNVLTERIASKFRSIKNVIKEGS